MFMVTPTNLAADCSLYINNVYQQTCSAALPLSLSSQSITITVSVSVLTDAQPVTQTYTYSAQQLPCSISSFVLSPNAVSSCLNAGSGAFDLTCLFILSSSSSLGFQFSTSQYCQYIAVQRSNGQAWVNTTASNALISAGLNNYQLVYSSISNPPQLVTLATSEITSGPSAYSLLAPF
jgi:hypothetical protein